MIGRSSTRRPTKPAKPRNFDDFDLRLGDLMRGERATLGKSLLDVQRELKIKAAYIAAIENADPSAFETQGFVAGYVRSYARYLDMDPEWAYGKFCEEGHFTVAHGLSAAASGPRVPRKTLSTDVGRDLFANPNTPFAPKGDPRFGRLEPGALGSIAVLVALVVGLGYGGWSILQEIQKVRLAPVEQAPDVAAEIGGMADPGAASALGLTSREVVAPSTDALDRLYRPQALDVPVLVARDGPIAGLRRDRPETAAVSGGDTLQRAADAALAEALGLGGTTALGDGTPAPQVIAADAPEVMMFAVRPSWVRVQAADGTVIFEKILDAGETFALPRTEAPPVLRAGNAGSVYFAVNGVNYGPAGGSGAVVKNIALSVDHLKEAYPVANLEADGDLAKFVSLAQAAGLASPAPPAFE